MQPLLLDTCALIWIVENDSIAPEAIELLNAANSSRTKTYVSPISAWEVGLLAARDRLRLLITPQSWFRRVLEIQQVELAPMPVDLLIDSSFLPGSPPRDPADRIIAATARDHGCTLLTRDRALIDYGEQGHIHVVAC